jgi:histone chaperone ASF1
VEGEEVPAEPEADVEGEVEMGGVEVVKDDASDAGSEDIEGESSEDEDEEEEGEEEEGEGEVGEDMDMDEAQAVDGNATAKGQPTDVMVH